MPDRSTDPVVIVGMACRYPDADDPSQLWDNVLSRRRSFRPLPAQRLPVADYGGDGADQVYLTSAAVLDGWIFDRQRFRVPGLTYRAVDLTHWLALEVAAAALADAGVLDSDRIDRNRVGVVLGNSLTGEFSRAALLRTRWPYVRRAVSAALAGSPLSPAARGEVLAAVEREYKAPFPAPSDESLAGALANTIAGRICNYFDFRGTGYTVDGACASSLLALTTAAAAAAEGQLDLALAGGVDLSLDPFELVGFSRLGALARGEMRVYDRRPTGFLPGEGCGVVVLCQESYARRHGLRPYARLLGWGTSSDGNGGLTRPEVAGQRLALSRAYASAGLEPERVRLVEGHGTGTEVGDPTELRALLEVRGDTGARAVLGSVKANIGHTKAAAGIAGVLKAVLALDQQILPPTTGCVDPHPLLAGGASLEISDEARPWEDPSRYASVSAMGFGGINTHVVLAGIDGSRRRQLSQRERRVARRHPDVELVVCAAGDIDELAGRLNQLRDAAAEMSRGELSDLAATLAATERTDASARFAAVARDPAELAAVLDTARHRLAAGERTILDHIRGVYAVVGRPLRVGLLFSGQAAPSYPDSGALGDLLAELPPGYQQRLEIPPDSPVDTAVAQPAILRASLAGLAWLDALGVRARQAVGHSLGEITALVWAGALTAADAYRMATQRGAAMAEASATVPAGMVSLATDLATASGLVDGTDAVIAADNADRQVVVSGARTHLQPVVERAKRAGVQATWLPVAHGFHSPLMAPAAASLRAAAGRIDWRPVLRTVLSTITGRQWRADDDPVELLVRQLTTPVRFREARSAMDAELLVEVGPGQILANLAGPAAVALDAGSASARGVAAGTAALFAAGALDTVEPYVARRFTRQFALPRQRRFLANPCDVDPPAAGLPATAEPAATVAVAGAEAPPSPVVTEAAAEDDDPVTLAVARVAALLELDPASIEPDARLLADLHLSSLKVTQIVGQLAADLDREQATTALATLPTTVAELAAAVAGLPPATAEGQTVAGVRRWIRAFAPDLAPAPPARPAPPAAPTPADPGFAWEIIGLSGHPLAEAISVRFPPRTGHVAPVRLLALPPGLDVPAAPIVAALRSTVSDRRPLAVLHHGGVGAAVGRSLAAEAPDVPVLVLEVPADAAGISLAAGAAADGWQGYTETVYRPDGTCWKSVLRPLAVDAGSDAAFPLRPGDVCVVTGGAKGIGLECALAVGAASGARLVLLGRSEAGDTQVRRAMERLSRSCVRAEYRQADLAAAAVGGAVVDLADRYGPVRVVLHSAGHNQPRPITDLTVDDLATTLAPKAYGLERLLAALDPDQLRMVVTFGSVIGRTGLAGEAAYAVANDWLGRRCAELARTRPGTRWLNIEWSAWSGTGMGERLGVLDNLSRQGLVPIPVDEGVRWLLRLMAAPHLPPSVLVTGRLPATTTVRWDGPNGCGTRGRFLETELTHTPAVELVADATVSLGTDPYLDDHRIDGTAVLPAALGLEAMAQACAALGAPTVPAAYRDLEFTRPITVPDRDRRTLRVAGLRADDGTVEVVARSDESGMAVDHFRAARCGTPADTSDGAAVGDQPAGDRHGVALLPAGPLYGPVFFHGPRFRRVRGYRAVGAYRCTAVIDADDGGQWFGGFLEQDLELGDPGARDAFLHALQVCVPDRQVLPVAVEQVTVHQRPHGRLTLDATQRAEEGDDYVFDQVIRDAGGAVVERWDGLRLHAVGPVASSRLPVAVIGAHLTRTLRRWRPHVDVELTVVARASKDWALAAAGPDVPVKVAWQWTTAGRVPPSAPPVPADVARLARHTGEDSATVAARVDACRRAVASGDGEWAVVEVGPVGWLRLTSDGRDLYSIALDTTAGGLAVAVAINAEPAPTGKR